MANQSVNQLSKHWQKFLLKFNETSSLDPSEWKEVHLLSYFCEMFEKSFSQKYSLSFKTTAPTKCPEINVIKRVAATLNTTDSSLIKEYILWVFEKKIIPAKTRIRSINYLLTAGYGNEFFQYWEDKNKVVKSTPLPAEYQQVADTLNVPVFTYGDLAFAQMALESSPDDESRAPYKTLFHTLNVLGFQLSVLERLK